MCENLNVKTVDINIVVIYIYMYIGNIISIAFLTYQKKKKNYLYRPMMSEVSTMY
jgi:hypothetical protein